MAVRGNIDPALRALKGLGRYQILQLLAIALSTSGASFQLFINIFTGREVTWQQCAAPSNISDMAQHLHGVDWNSSSVTYGRCEIIVSKDNQSDDTLRYPCLFGYHFDFPKELSYRTEFELVCDWKLLGGVAQTMVIFGQGVGAVITSVFSDRYGRKLVMVTSQLGLFAFGICAAFAPDYPVLVFVKFLLGALQQAVINSSVSLGTELLPAEHRSVRTLIYGSFWSIFASSLALFSFLLRNYRWRYLQIAMSCASAPVALFQLWYLDESLRWLVANGKKKTALRVLERASNINRKDFSVILKLLETSIDEEEKTDSSNPSTDQDGSTDVAVPAAYNASSEEKAALDEMKSARLTILDILKKRIFLVNTLITSFLWFTCAFSFFGLYMMSTGLHGSRFINYFLMALMNFVPLPVLYVMFDRIGRKWTLGSMITMSGCGLIVSGVCRIFSDSPVLRTMSVVAAMLGMGGASGQFNGIYQYNAELYPTNFRTQALGLSSFTGRLGGMMAPFLTDLADVAVWAPGALIGTFCFLAACLIYLLPETKGRPLPATVADVYQWYDKGKDTKHIGCLLSPSDKQSQV